MARNLQLLVTVAVVVRTRGAVVLAVGGRGIELQAEAAETTGGKVEGAIGAIEIGETGEGTTVNSSRDGGAPGTPQGAAGVVEAVLVGMGAMGAVVTKGTDISVIGIEAGAS